MTIMEDNRVFCEDYIEPMIHKFFPAYEDRIAVGVVGEGSECFGYDDNISEDHDYGIGVCLWLTEEDYMKIGKELQKEYNTCVTRWYLELYRRTGDNSLHGDDRLARRRGVHVISQFYEHILGFPVNPLHPELSDRDWFFTDEWKFAALTNGIVYTDELGLFTKVRRELLRYYPERVWRIRLANTLHEFAGAMQANYGRCMARKDLVAANYCKTRSIDAAMDILFLVNKRYAPYYKWKFKAFHELIGHEAIAELLVTASTMSPSLEAWEGYEYDSRKINDADPLVRIFEQIAELLADRLYKERLISNTEVFLEKHCWEVARGR